MSRSIDGRATALLSFKKDIAAECTAARYQSRLARSDHLRGRDWRDSKSRPSLRPRQYPCEKCPLRPLDGVPRFREEELAFVSKFKNGELASTRARPSWSKAATARISTRCCSGWGFRYKLMARRRPADPELPDAGRPDRAARQPDGRDAAFGRGAVADAALRVRARQICMTLYRNHPGLAYDITWIASREEQMLDENLLSIGRRTALERAAYLIAFICAARGQGRLARRRQMRPNSRSPSSMSPIRSACRWSTPTRRSASSSTAS